MVEIKLDDLRGVADVLRQVVRDWDDLVSAVDALTREHQELRAWAEQKERDYRELQGTHERLRQEHEANTRRVGELEAAYQTLLREHEANMSALRELREQHQALLEDRQYARDQLEALLGRLKP